MLDRKHEAVNADKVTVTTRNNIANIRFTSPSDVLLRPHYYITFPSGDVKEYSFSSEQISSDGYLMQGVLVNLRLPLSEDGNYILELVRNDGIAYANIMIPRGNVWAIIDPLTDTEIRTIRKNPDTVRQSILFEINTLRKKINKSSVILDHTLSTLAQAKVDDMIARNYQSHADPDGNYIDALAKRLGLDIEGGMGENI